MCRTGEISLLEQVPAEGAQGLVVEGAPSSSESAPPTLQRHPGKKNCCTACIHGYMHNRIWRTYKINQYHLSEETFWGLWKVQPSYFSQTRSIYSCDCTGGAQDPNPTVTCNLEFIGCFWFVFSCERAACFKPTTKNPTELQRNLQPSYTRPQLHRAALKQCWS